MSAIGDATSFFQNMGSSSPNQPRQKFCGMFCPVEGSSENKTLDFDSLSSGKGRVIERQKDVSNPRKVEIRRSAGKENLQNLKDEVRAAGIVHVEEELPAIQGGVVRMRAALRYENLSFCLRQSGWTWCISGEEILGTGLLSFTFLALLPPPFAS
ncbi:unnamed protein product [Leuciscus chuanchicus]